MPTVIDLFILYLDSLDYYGNRDRFEELERGLSEMSSVQTGSVDFWLSGFVRWLNSTSNINATGQLNSGKHIIIPPQTVFWGYTVLTLSFRPSVRPSVRNKSIL